MRKFIKLVKHDFLLLKPRQQLLIIFLFLMCLEVISRMSCSITFLGIKVRLTDLQFPEYSLLPFLKVRMILAFCRSSGTYSSQHDWSETIESSLAMTSARSLSSYGCIPSVPVYIGMPSFLKSSLTLSTRGDPYPPRVQLPCSSLFPWSLGPRIPEGQAC